MKKLSENYTILSITAVCLSLYFCGEYFWGMGKTASDARLLYHQGLWITALCYSGLLRRIIDTAHIKPTKNIGIPLFWSNLLVIILVFFVWPLIEPLRNHINPIVQIWILVLAVMCFVAVPYNGSKFVFGKWVLVYAIIGEAMTFPKLVITAYIPPAPPDAGMSALAWNYGWIGANINLTLIVIGIVAVALRQIWYGLDYNEKENKRSWRKVTATDLNHGEWLLLRSPSDFLSFIYTKYRMPWSGCAYIKNGYVYRLKKNGNIEESINIDYLRKNYTLRKMDEQYTRGVCFQFLRDTNYKRLTWNCFHQVSHYFNVKI
ncbi:MAG: hypothetical protein GY757_18765 [bacterium]|nr:hypothetical protein [bacterium]